MTMRNRRNSFPQRRIPNIESMEARNLLASDMMLNDAPEAAVEIGAAAGEEQLNPPIVVEDTDVVHGAWIRLDDGVLNVRGTDDDDLINISEISSEHFALGNNSIQNGPLMPPVKAFSIDLHRRPLIKVTMISASISETAMFDKSLVQTILVSGRAGDDYVHNATGLPSTVYGGDGDDTLHGGFSDDMLFGQGGNDNLYGKAGNDVLHGDNLRQSYSGHTPTINDHRPGGNDRLFGGAGYDYMHGGKGDDYLDGGTEADQLFGNNGHDTLLGRGGDDFLFGQLGEDNAYGFFGIDTIWGGEDDDNLWGGGDDDFIQGHGGNDVLYGHTGIDTLNGGPDDDYISGGLHDDTLHGSSGNDILSGNAGNDILYGGANFDRLYGGFGDDVLYGQGDQDFLYGDEFQHSYTGEIQSGLINDHRGGDDQLFGGSGPDVLHGGGGDDLLSGGTGQDHLYGNDGNDTLRGDQMNDHLYGQVGNDNLYGGGNDDSLNGGIGNDGLYGGSGVDQLRGGSGDDRFLVLNDVNVPIKIFGITIGYTQTTADTIRDFHSTDAKINFEHGEERTLNFSGGLWAEIDGGTFTPGEIEQVDMALADLHHQVGNTSLLKQKGGAEITFERLGAQTDGNFNIKGVNSGGTMALLDSSFDDTQENLAESVFHEIGHYWDNENDHWDAWKAISRWNLGPVPGQSTETTDGMWYYNVDSTFAREYGRTNPREDFATYFAKVMMDDNGLDYSGSGHSAAKEEFMDDFFASLRTTGLSYKILRLNGNRLAAGPGSGPVLGFSS